MKLSGMRNGPMKRDCPVGTYASAEPARDAMRSRKSKASKSRTRYPPCPITTRGLGLGGVSGGYVTQVQGGEHGVAALLWSRRGGEQAGEGGTLDADFPSENQERYETGSGNGELVGDGVEGITGDCFFSRVEEMSCRGNAQLTSL